MRVADTSFIFALFDLNEKEHATSVAWATDGEPIVMLPEVLGETLGILERRLGHERAQHVWEQLKQMPNLEFLETTDVEFIGYEFKRGAGKLSWVDAAVVAECRAEKGKPLTFDKRIVQALRA